MTSRPRLRWGFIVWLFIIGTIVGVIANNKDLLKESVAYLEKPNEHIKEDESKKSESIDTAPKILAVAVRDVAFENHPLYREVEKLEREITASKLEQAAYTEMLAGWQDRDVIIKIEDYLKKQYLLVKDSIERSTKELSERKTQEMNAEKESVKLETEKTIEREKERIVQNYAKQLAENEAQYLNDIKELQQEHDAQMAQTKYSIKVDIGIESKKSEVNTDTEEPIYGLDTQLGEEIIAREKEWQTLLNNLQEKQKKEIADLEVREYARLKTRLNEIDDKYRKEQENISVDMAKEISEAEKRSIELFLALQNINVNASEKQAQELLESFNQKQKRQLDLLITRRDKLIIKIEQELVFGLRVLAQKNGCVPGELVAELPNDVIDLTDELIELLTRTEEYLSENSYD